ncbi:MAG: MFS transporter, partial [Chloroflexota bacterium]|nr:MFS transporter [Chloroflexota bacterium]
HIPSIQAEQRSTYECYHATRCRARADRARVRPVHQPRLRPALGRTVRFQFFATGTLHVAAALYGFLAGASGVGLLAGAIVGGLYAGRFGLTRVLWLSLVALGLLVLVYARLTSFGPALLVLFLVGVPNGTLNVVINPLLLQVTPRAFVGRVSAVLMPVMSVAALLSIAVSGLLDSTILHGFHARLLGVTFGPIDTIFSMAGLLGVAGGLYAFLNLRHTSITQPTEDTVV